MEMDIEEKGEEFEKFLEDNNKEKEDY